MCPRALAGAQDKDALAKILSRFGAIVNIAIEPKNRSAIVEYARNAGAEKALSFFQAQPKSDVFAVCSIDVDATLCTVLDC